MSEADRKDENEQLLAQLLRESGRGPKASPAARERVYSTVHAHWRRSLPQDGVSRTDGTQRRQAWTWSRGLALAASVAAIALVAYFVQAPELGQAADFAHVAKREGVVEIVRGGETRPVALGAAVVVRVNDALATGAGGGVALRLESGYTLRIKADSAVVVAAVDRVELRSGAVYFDSGPEGTGAGMLQIATPFGIVRHVGTQFEASLEGSRLRVRVREGEAVIAESAREIRAAAGEQVSIDANGEPVREALAANDPAWGWVEDLATLPAADRYPLLDVFGWISRETGLPVEFDDAAARASAEIVVLYELEGLSPRQALEVINDTTEFDYRETSTAVLVSHASP